MKEKQKLIAQKIQELYNATYEFNVIGGKSISPEYIESQELLVVEEAIEGIIGKLRGNQKEYLDGVIDTIVTASFQVMLAEKNTSLLTHEIKYFNVDNKTENELLSELLLGLLNKNWIQVLECAEDLCMMMRGNTLHNLDQVIMSNKSKYPLVKDVEIKDLDLLCEAIEDQKRYTGVEVSVSKNLDGEEVYVFTAERDLKEGVTFSKPKIVKHPLYFIEPVLEV